MKTRCHNEILFYYLCTGSGLLLTLISEIRDMKQVGIGELLCNVRKVN